MSFNPSSVNYILRYYFPPEAADERLGEVIDFCKKTGTEHVMFMCGPQHRTWNIIPLDVAHTEVEVFKTVGEELSKRGIRMGLNMGMTLGHSQSRWDHRERFPEIKYWATDMEGRSPYKIPCAVDPALRKHIREIYRIYASCQPDYIHIDDDLRYDTSPTSWGCFCDRHLELFAQRTGSQWTRESLKPALINDLEIRSQWVEMLGESLRDVARDATMAVHEVNPKISMGVMLPCVHTMPLFGHPINALLDVVEDGATPVVRACIGPYQDWLRRELPMGLFYMEMVAHFLAGRNVQYTPEIETTPFTRLSKSMTIVRFHITQAILNGMANPAITVAGYVGDHVALEPAYLDSLPQDKPYYQAVHDAAPDPSTKRGVQLFFDFNSPKLAKRKLCSHLDLMWPAMTLPKILSALGFCYTLNDSPVKLLAGESLRGMNVKQVDGMMTRGLILDATAAEALVDMGYSEQIGVTVGAEVTGWMSEKHLSAEFSGPYVDTYTPLKWIGDDPIRHLSPADDARVLSRVIDGDDGEVCPGVVLYENAQGGRVAVLPFTISYKDDGIFHLLCYQRRYMLRKIIEWMNPAVLPVFVEDPTDIFVQCWDDGEVLTVGLTNASYDSCSELTVTFEHPGKLCSQEATFIADDGTTQKIDLASTGSDEQGRPVWTIHHECHAFRPLLMRIPHSWDE
jgi:hypothetical protein